MKGVYISGPLNADNPYKIEQNVDVARCVAHLMWRLGLAVLCPHLNTLGMVGMLAKEEQFLEGDLRLMKGMDGVVMLPFWLQSVGAKVEHQYAIDAGMEIWTPNEVDSRRRWKDYPSWYYSNGTVWHHDTFREWARDG